MSAPMTIVDELEILNADVIRSENLRLVDLCFRDNLELFKWLVRRRLLRNSCICEMCQVSMSLGKRKNVSDGYSWRCNQCDTTTSIRKNSIFSKSKLSMQQLVIMIYGWARDYPQHIIIREARISNRSTHTIVDWCNFCREICEQDLIDNSSAIGGLNKDFSSKTVEIDESKFFHKKYHRGQWREGHWVFGGIERTSGECFLVEVPDRSEETLSTIIQEYILPGTIIVSDERRAYNNIDTIQGGVYEHQVIIDPENFVDSDDHDVHVEYMENMWMCVKRKLKRQFRTSKALFPSYMHEFIWRNKFKNSDLFSEFIVCVNNQF